MEPFIGKLFCCTRHSTYQVTIPSNLISRPTVMKVATIPDGRELRVPVAGTFRYGFFIAITRNTLWQYSAHVTPSLERPAPQPSSVPSGILGAEQAMNQTGDIVGLFLNRADADDCQAANQKAYDTAGPQSQLFDLRWIDDTERTLRRIGTNHPLICIATDNCWGVPERFFRT